MKRACISCALIVVASAAMIVAGALWVCLTVTDYLEAALAHA